MTDLLVSDPSALADPPGYPAPARSLVLGLDLTALGAAPTPWSPTIDDPRTEIDVQRVIDLARLAERGVLDFVAFDDEFALAYSPVRSTASRLDAARIACRVAPATSGVGLVATLDTSYLDPVHVATAVATLHEKSAGRAGWQVGASQARLLGHTDQVWARLSREIRTVVAARVHRAAEAAAAQGRQAPASTAPAIVVRADSSLAAQAAGRLADVARIEALDAQDARALRREVRRAAAESGRDPDDVKVLIDVVALVSHDAAAARARRDLLADLTTSEPAWVRTLSHLGSTAQLTDLLEAWVSDEVVDGFTILPGSLPHDLRALVAEVAPQLQERGLLRTSYGRGEGQSPATP
jgi:alkanesulfonate monooxygenase SsuD/methylene tetrahydromethanopterin reductase-like flavin-dependent oxidoreductase (luciferase family)